MARILKPERQKSREANARSRARKRGEDVPYLTIRRRNYKGEIFPQHGTYEEYSAHGCRCDSCKQAASITRKRGAKKWNPIRNKMKLEKRERLRDITRSAKNVPCTDCGNIYPYFVMQFDHLYDKKFALSSSDITGHTASEILDEIKKCEVVCSNCHHMRTHRNHFLEKFVLPTPMSYNLQFGRWSKTLPEVI